MNKHSALDSLNPELHPVLADFRRAVADDLLGLALLHHSEPTRELLDSLRREARGLSLGLNLNSPDGKRALDKLCAAINGLPAALDAAALDELAADYADIYITHAYGASPYESVWLDDDRLMRQEPMFQVRAYYAKRDLMTKNWRTRPDDHLALQLQFLAHLFSLDSGDALAEAARFMDEHLLRWLPQFARRVAERCRTPFFAGLALLTDAYCEEARDLLALILAEPRPTPAVILPRVTSSQPSIQVPSPFLPGMGPSW